MGIVDIKRRKILLAITSMVGSSLVGCVTAPGLGVPNSGRAKPTSKRSAQDAFRMGKESPIDSITRQHEQLRHALSTFRQDFLRGEGQSYEALNERVIVPYVALMHRIFAAVENKDQVKSAMAKIHNGKITIAPGEKLAYTQKGYCMNKSVPAPVKGDALELQPLAGKLEADLVPIMQALGEWSTRSPANASKTQMLTWGLMDVGTDRGRWIPNMNPEMRRLYDDVLPGASNQMIANQNGYELTKKAIGFALEKTKLNRYVSTDMLLSSTQDHKASNELLDELIRQGYLDKGGKGIGYSTIAPNVHARATGVGVLTARIEVFNDGEMPIEYLPQEYYTNPLANKQPISPTTSITDLVFDNNGILSQENREKFIEKIIKIGVDASTDVWKELADGLYQKVFGGLSKKTPAFARAVRKLIRNPKLGKLFGGAIGATPILGNALSAYEFFTGKDWVTGEVLNPTERLVAALGTIPGANTLRAIGKGLLVEGLEKASNKTIFKLASAETYSDIKNFLDSSNKWAKVSDTLFGTEFTEKMKTLIVDEPLPWHPTTMKYIEDLKNAAGKL